jgi:hypothetical protein
MVKARALERFLERALFASRWLAKHCALKRA